MSLIFFCGATGARAQAVAHLGRQPADQTMRISVVLPLRNQPALSDLIKRLYSPGDPLYGKYLKPNDFTTRFGPDQSAIDSVTAFAAAHNLAVADVSSNHTIVHLAGSTADVEAAFGIRLNAYRRADGSTFRTPDATPALPAAIHNAVGVFGLDTSMQPRRYSHFAPAAFSSTTQSNSLFSTGVSGLDPSDVRSVYDLPLTKTSTNGSEQTLALFETDGWTPSDITFWENQYGLPINAPILRSVDGGNGHPNTSGGSSETTLDIDMELTLAPNATIIVYDSPGIDYGQEAIDIDNAIATDDTASVISSSIGGSEQDQSISFIDAENQAFEQFAAQGQTMCASGGDSGAFNDQGNFPNTPTVSDPASDPFVLAVGGTFLNDTSTEGYSSESSWAAPSDKSRGPDGTGGGGGISSIWTIPSYQVNAFSTSVNTQSSTTMRNIPDVSLFGDFDEGGYSIYFTDPTTGTPGWYVANGTSASSPLYASFLANVNQLRQSKGLGNIGLSQPAIYAIAEQPTKYAADFHDIADGSNNLLYVAVTGFDDTTGWGSFNGVNLLADMGSFGNKVVPEFLSFDSNPAPAGTSITGTVTLSGAAPASGASVVIKRGATKVTTVTVPTGQISAQFTTTLGALMTPGTYTYTATYDGGSVSVPLVVEPEIKIASITLDPNAILSGQSSQITVTLNENAPADGVNVTILFNGGFFDTMNIAGSNSGSVFIFLGGLDGSYPIEAKYGTSQKTTDLHIVSSLPNLVSFALAKSSMGQGLTTTGKITLSGPAPAGGAAIDLQSSNTSAATVPSRFVIAAGKTFASVTVTAAQSVNSPASTNISAAYNGTTLSAPLIVNPAALSSVTISPATVTGSAGATGTVHLAGVASSPFTVNLSSTNTKIAQAPASVVEPSGSSSATFPITTTDPATATKITIKAVAGVTKSASLTVDP